MEKILLESFGNLYRLSLPVNASEHLTISFANLAWLCGTSVNDSGEFMAYQSRVRKAIRALRIAKTANWFHSTKWNAQARKRHAFLLSGISFVLVDQRGTGRDYTPKMATVGNADYQNATDNWSMGAKSQLEPVQHETYHEYRYRNARGQQAS